VSVASSLGAAAAGAGALGAGMAASLAPMLVVGKQVSSRFEEVKKAYEAVQTAQREGTAESKKNADQALADLSKNERAMVGSLGRLSTLQEKVLGGASDRVFGGLSRAIDVLAPKLEGLAKPFDRLGGAIGGAIGRVAGLLSSGPWQSALKKFVDSATGLVRPITSTFEHIGNILRDVAVAALPYVQKAVQGVADWFGELDRKATQSKIREIVGELVEHTKSWFGLFRALGGLVDQGDGRDGCREPDGVHPGSRAEADQGAREGDVQLAEGDRDRAGERDHRGGEGRAGSRGERAQRTRSCDYVGDLEGPREDQHLRRRAREGRRRPRDHDVDPAVRDRRGRRGPHGRAREHGPGRGHRLPVRAPRLLRPASRLDHLERERLLPLHRRGAGRGGHSGWNAARSSGT
jgi:hypothetical protein